MSWIKFDLHQHTRNELPTDRKPYQSTYTHRKFRDLIIEQGVSLKAVTNHNILDVTEHIKYALICKSIGVSYLPGVEIDYRFGSDRFHAISILNPSIDIVAFSKRLEQSVPSEEVSEQITFGKEEFSSIHENTEFIFIPHYNKTRGIMYKNLDESSDEHNWVINMIASGHSIPIILENTQDHHKYTAYAILKSKIDEHKSDYVPCYTGTDYKFDNDVQRQENTKKRLIYKMNAEPTYRGLEIAIRNYKLRIREQSQIIDRNNYIKRIDFLPNDNFGKIESINLSPSLNVIIGSSGSGKTLLLNEIFYSVNGDDLADVKGKLDIKTKIKPKQYKNIIGDNEWLNIIKKDNESPLKMIEIPNLYNMILGKMDNVDKLGTLFGISNVDKLETIINDYKVNIIKYEKTLDEDDDSKKAGEKNLDAVASGVEFLEKNSVGSENYHLKMLVNDNSKLEALQTKKDSIIELQEKKEMFFSYLNDIQQVLGTDASVNVINIKQNMEELMAKLSRRLIMLETELIAQKLSDRIITLVNRSIENQTRELGDTTAAVIERDRIIQKNRIDLVENIVKVLKNQYTRKSIDLEYPLLKIIDSLKENNTNEYARYQINFSEDDLSSIDLLDSQFINTNRREGKIKRVVDRIKEVDLLDNEQVIEMVNALREESLKLSEIIESNSDSILKIQLKVKGMWKDDSKINPGDVSKLSMGYYFNNIVSNEQPDVVLIDQPENDLDKDFITNVLSMFIRDSKIKQQIIITSHDPILTVNSDVNTIIESKINEENKIYYEGFRIEEIEDGRLVTDRVAKILDGSKKNIMNRYNIYGGMKND